MAITATTLAADLAVGATTMTVTSGTGFPAVDTIANPGYLVRIDNEYFYAIAQPVAATIKLRGRGSAGTAAKAHDILSAVLVSSVPSDFNEVPAGSDVQNPPFLPVQETIGEDITFTTGQVASWGNRPRDFQVNKGSLATIVLVAPSKAQDGLVIRFLAVSPYVHVITATTLLANGDTASPYTTATHTNTKAGGALTLQAQNGLWNVVSATFWAIS